MPNVALPLNDVNQSVSRPVVDTVVKQLQEILSIDDLYLIYPGDTQKVKQPNTTIDDPKGKRDPMLSSTRRAVLEVTEGLDPKGISSHPAQGPEYPPVFYDHNLEFLIRPQYGFYNVELKYNYITDSRVEAFRWYNEIYTKAGNMRQNAFLHSLDYHYNIPPIVVELFETIYKLRENVAGFHDTIQDYFKMYSVPRFTYNTDLVGKHSVLSVQERQTRVIGVMQWDGIVEKPEKNHEQSTWTASFTYKFTYEKPIGINFLYPISVHNQLLPAKFIKDTNQEEDLRNTMKRFSYSHNGLYDFEITTVQDKFFDQDLVVRMPNIDDFVLSYSPRHIMPVFTALCLIDPKDPTLFMNLKELDGYKIDKRILDFLTDGEYKYACSNFKSIFNIRLYRGNKLAGDNVLYLDKDLNVRSKIPLNVRQQHRIQFSLVTDIGYILPGAVERVLSYRPVVPVLLYYLNEVFASYPLKRNMFLNTKIKLQDFLDISYREMDRRDNEENIKKILENETGDDLPGGGNSGSSGGSSTGGSSGGSSSTDEPSGGGTSGSGSGGSGSSTTTTTKKVIDPNRETNAQDKIRRPGEGNFLYDDLGDLTDNARDKAKRDEDGLVVGIVDNGLERVGSSIKDENGVVSNNPDISTSHYVKIKDVLKDVSIGNIVHRKTQLNVFIQAYERKK